uniref:Uncharacterized protein n=1 Tax=Meloidogyne hapla TaxID=6305 RepID=A0A1I8BHH2_MELHA
MKIQIQKSNLLNLILEKQQKEHCVFGMQAKVSLEAKLIEVLKRNKRWQIDGTFACAPTTVEQQLKQLNVIYRSSTKAKKASTICATGATYYGNTGRCNVRR